MGNNRVINVEVALPSGSQMRFSAIPEISNANSSYLSLSVSWFVCEFFSVDEFLSASCYSVSYLSVSCRVTIKYWYFSFLLMSYARIQHSM